MVLNQTQARTTLNSDLQDPFKEKEHFAVLIMSRLVSR